MLLNLIKVQQHLLKSLKRNKIQNVEVIQSFLKALKNLPEKHIDVMLFDAPRTGLV